jgi:hypothetical protein
LNLLGFAFPDSGDMAVELCHLGSYPHLHLHPMRAMVVVVGFWVTITPSWLGPSVGNNDEDDSKDGGCGKRWWEQ